jgi:hypothetical protein
MVTAPGIPKPSIVFIGPYEKPDDILQAHLHCPLSISHTERLSDGAGGNPAAHSGVTHSGIESVFGFGTQQSAAGLPSHGVHANP